MRRITHWEDAEARALIQWSDFVPEIRGRLTHIPNGGKRGRVEAARLKGMGVRAGYPDFLLDLARGGYHGLRIELKAKRPNDAPVTASQLEWLERLSSAGYACMVARGSMEAQRGIELYLRGNFPPFISAVAKSGQLQ